jgi:transposase
VRQREDLLPTRLPQQTRLRDTTEAVVRPSLPTVRAVGATQVAAGDRPIAAHWAAHTALRTHRALRISIVGIGTVTAAKWLAALAAIAQDESAHAVAAATGLPPTHDETGTAVRRRSRMSKGGKAGLRAALSWPAITAMTHGPAFKAFAERLAAKDKPKGVVLGAVMRKMVHIVYGVLKHQTPDDPAKVPGPSGATT